MKYSNELKVGVSIIFAAVVFILGIRYFEDLPLFRGTYTLETEFTNAAGLIAGNVVRVNGVNVGSVDEVSINPENNQVRVRFHVDRSVPVTQGSETMVSGFDALGVVRMDLELGPPGGLPIPLGGFVPSRQQEDVLKSLTSKAPGMVERMGTALDDLSTLLRITRGMLDDPAGDTRQALAGMRSAVVTLDDMMRSEKERISAILTQVEGITTGVNRAMGPEGDSLVATLEGMSALMTRVDESLVTLDATAGNINLLLERLNRGEGTIGLLLTDPGMYHRMDSLMLSIEALVTDFQTDPGRYLKEMRIVDLF